MPFAVPLSQPRPRVRFGIAATVAGALLCALPASARAEQFLLFDAMFTFTWDDAVNASIKSHYFVTEKNFLNKARPTNWVSPVNYRDGKVHIRAEVIDKPPGTQQAGWALCYIANVGNYGCPYTDYYTKVGVYERDADMHTFYNNNTLDWTHGVKEVDLVYTINGSGSGHITNFPQLKDLVTPTTVRISMIQLSPGATYDPSILPNVAPRSDAGADAGAGDAAADAPAAVADAAPVTGSGGAGAPPVGGTGGVENSGTGGVPATGGASGSGSGNVSAGGCALLAENERDPRALVAAVLLSIRLFIRRQRRRRRR